MSLQMLTQSLAGWALHFGNADDPTSQTPTSMAGGLAVLKATLSKVICISVYLQTRRNTGLNVSEFLMSMQAQKLYLFVHRARAQRLSDMLIYNEYVKTYLKDVVTSSLAVHGVPNNITILPLL